MAPFMLNRLISFLPFFTVLLVLQAGHVFAQNAVSEDGGDTCNVPYETLTRLFEPAFGSYTVWDNTFGEGVRQESFSTAVEMDDGTVLVAGEMVPLNGVKSVIVLANYDTRGRLLWEKFHAVSAVTGVVRMLKAGDRYVLLVNRNHRLEPKNIWLGFFDKEGKFKGQKVIRDKKFDLFATDMVLSPDQKRVVISATMERNIGSKEEPEYLRSPEIHIVDLAGNEIVRRAFFMGENSEILGVSYGKIGDDAQDAIITTGYLENEYSKKSGWMMRLNADASLVWQKQYSRGLSSRVTVSSPYLKDYILGFGDAVPADKDAHIGSWLMLLDAADGEVQWQRYYHGGYDYLAKGMLVNNDHLVSLVMQGRVPELDDDGNVQDATPKIEEDGSIVGKMNYVHMLRLTPRGITTGGETYFKGLGAQINGISVMKDGNYLLAGQVVDTYETVLEKFEGFKQATEDEMASSKEPKLPEAQMPEKSLSGLALLNKTMADEVKRENMERASDDDFEDETAMSLTKDGWILVGQGPDPYEDPCRRVVVELP